MVEETRGGLEDARNAVIISADLVVPTFELFHAGVIDEAADKEIEFAVIVVIEPDGASGPARSGDTGFVGDVGEGGVAVVLVKDAFAVGSDEHVRPVVVVEIADGDAHAEVSAGDTGFFGDVGEGAVAIVFVKSIADGLGRWRLPKIAGAAVDEEDVHPSVVVEIEKGATGAERFGEVAARRDGIFVDPVDMAGGRRDLEEERLRCLRRLRLRLGEGALGREELGDADGGGEAEPFSP